MKLSTAMMLGSTTCKMEAGDWNSCALGCAGNAVGIMRDFSFVIGGVRYETGSRQHRISAVWPWLLDSPHYISPKDYEEIIFTKFDEKVCEKKMSFESLIAYVQRVEPACGECCKFACSCVPEASSVTVNELVAEVA